MSARILTLTLLIAAAPLLAGCTAPAPAPAYYGTFPSCGVGATWYEPGLYAAVGKWAEHPGREYQEFIGGGLPLAAPAPGADQWDRGRLSMISWYPMMADGYHFNLYAHSGFWELAISGAPYADAMLPALDAFLSELGVTTVDAAALVPALAKNATRQNDEVSDNTYAAIPAPQLDALTSRVAVGAAVPVGGHVGKSALQWGDWRFEYSIVTRHPIMEAGPNFASLQVDEEDHVSLSLLIERDEDPHDETLKSARRMLRSLGHEPKLDALEWYDSTCFAQEGL